jgi:hypothetical protein
MLESNFEESHPHLYKSMRASHPSSFKAKLDLELSGNKKREEVKVQFCGLVCAPVNEGITSAVFLPLQALASKDTNLDTAKMTMQVIAKYLRNKKRVGKNGLEGSGDNWLSTIKSIADDYTEYGIYSDRQRTRGRNNGKANWARTVVRETPLIGDAGNIVYTNVLTSRAQDDRDNLLTQTQVVVLREIASQHGWWLPSLPQNMSQFQGFQTERISNRLRLLKLKALLPNLFSNRAIRLTNYLIYYFERISRNGKSAQLFGLDDFHSVWEGMLRDVLEDTKDGWNTKLPKPVFYKGVDSESDEGKKMMMDIVIRQGANLVIVDAKYYAATTTKNSPSMSDISKQLMYELAVRDMESEDGVPHNLSSCFVFPASSTNTDRQFTMIKMEYKTDRPQSKLPSINCYYMPIVEVMQAYLNNTKIYLPNTYGS